MAAINQNEIEMRIILRSMSTTRLLQAYNSLQAGQPSGIDKVDADRELGVKILNQVLWERGRLPPGGIPGGAGAAARIESAEMHHSPISAHCQATLSALERGDIKCYDWRETRSASLCKAFEIMEKEKLPNLPVHRGWDAVKRKCTLD